MGQERTDYIVENIENEAASKRSEELPRWKRIFVNRGRKTRLRYKKRTFLAILILTVFLLAYVIMFVNGNPLGAKINDWTDSLIAPIFTWIMTSLGALMGRDWSDMTNVFVKISTIGPLSYIVVTSVISFAIAAIVAFCYGRAKTKKSRDDGTSNFAAEKTREAD